MLLTLRHNPRQLIRELSYLQINEQRNFEERLDRHRSEQDAAHQEALAAAAAEHDKVRREAELVKERVLVEQQLQREIEHQQQLREVEQLRQEAAQRQLAIEKERTQALQAREAAERAAAEERETRAAAQRAKDAVVEKARVDRVKREADEARAATARRETQKNAAEAEAKAKADAKNAAKARAQAAINARVSASPSISAAPATQPVKSAPTSQPMNPGRESEHKRYLEVHQNLKKMRKFMNDEAKRNPTLKKQMGESRREIRKRVGQLTGDTKKNTEPMRAVKALLQSALSQPHPTVNILDFLAQPPPNPANPNACALLLYLLNIFSKALISQFLSEASVSPKLADPVGIIGTSVFATPEFHWNSIPLVDILLAKFHAKCPVLFGIFGDESSAAGKKRLGWHVEEDGTFVSAQRQAERMTGLGAGFAALTLRTFANSRLKNPLPTWHFWRALASIVNVPPERATPTHFYVLKALVEFNVQRILEFWGTGGKAALRLAVVVFPERVAVRGHVAARSVALLKDVFVKEHKLYLEG